MDNKRQNGPDIFLQRLATLIIGAQVRLANRMGRMEQGLSIRMKKMLLVMFIAVASCYLCHLLYRAVAPGERISDAIPAREPVEMAPLAKPPPGRR